MKQRTAFLIAAALTAFVLVVGGAVAGRISEAASSAKASAAQAETGLAVEDSAEAVSSEIEVLLAREAALRELVQQANARLKQVNQERRAVNAPAVSASQAALFAITGAPGGILLSQPRLVDFQGILAYEIELDLARIYVDASTGALLWSSAGSIIPPVVTTPPPFMGSGGMGHGISQKEDRDAGRDSGNQGGDRDDDHEDDHGGEDDD